MKKLNQILLDNRNNIESSAEKCPFCHGENDRCEYFTTVESRLGQLGSYQINDCLTQELLEQIKERLRGETVEVWAETGEVAIDLAKSLVLIKPAIGLYHVLAELPLVGRIIRSLARDMGLNLEDLELWWERNFQIIFNAIAVSHPALKEKLVDRDFNMEIFNRCRTALRAINKELDTAQEISVFAVADWGKRIDTKPDFTGMVICGPVEVLKLEDYVYRRLIDFEERLLTQVNGIQYECAHWKELRLAFLDEWRDLTGALEKFF